MKNIFALIIILLFLFSCIKNFFHQEKFTVIPYNYQQLMQHSNADVARLLNYHGNKISDHYIQFIKNFLADRPYVALGAQGEGDWCTATKHDCVHIQQDPIYRTDKLNCQTLAQLIVALTHSNNLQQFQRVILNVDYGAAGTSNIAFYNRNNFVSADFNPTNYHHGYIHDATRQGILKNYAKYTTTIIDRQRWFENFAKSKYLHYHVRVLDAKNGLPMVQRLSNGYPQPYYNFTPEKVRLDYIPKAVVKTVINALPTPSIIEIIRNPKYWRYHQQPIKQAVGSNLNVSHLGALYRQHFYYQQLIYHKITCMSERVCKVKPIYCLQKTGCTKTMFLHATDAYPQGYYYYHDSLGHYYCTGTKPYYGQHYSYCNRIIAMPIDDYFQAYQYGKYIYMDSKSILGIHVEKLT